MLLGSIELVFLSASVSQPLPEATGAALERLRLSSTSSRKRPVASWLRRSSGGGALCEGSCLVAVCLVVVPQWLVYLRRGSHAASCNFVNLCLLRFCPVVVFFLFVCFYSEVLRYGNNFSLLVDFVTYEGKTLQHNPVQ